MVVLSFYSPLGVWLKQDHQRTAVTAIPCRAQQAFKSWLGEKAQCHQDQNNLGNHFLFFSFFLDTVPDGKRCQYPHLISGMNCYQIPLTRRWSGNIPERMGKTEMCVLGVWRNYMALSHICFAMTLHLPRDFILHFLLHLPPPRIMSSMGEKKYKSF